MDSDLAMRVQARFAAGEQELAGLPLDACRSSVAVAFPDDSLHPLPGLTEQVHLTFGGAAMSRPYECPAYTMYRSTQLGVARLRFGVSATAKRVLNDLPFKREAYRALVKSDEPSFVEIEEARLGRNRQGELHDVSLGGLSFCVHQRFDPEFTPDTELYLTFQLPDMEEQLCITGVVRYSRPVEDNRQYGVRFDFESVDHPTGVREALYEYILTRQRNILKVLNGDG